MDDRPGHGLGRIIEPGLKSGPPGGRGFHNSIHEYLGSRERKSATGAEMNKLRKSLYNDYFWSLHLWIDGQYGRLLENLGKKFDTGRQAPGDPMDTMHRDTTAMHKRTHSRIKAKRAAPAEEGAGILS